MPETSSTSSRAPPPPPEGRYARAVADLGAARARIAELEQIRAEILSSPTWRLAQRLRRGRERLAGLGPIGRLASRLIRVGQIALNEGPGGLVDRTVQRLPGWVLRRGPFGRLRTRVPRGLPPMSIPPLADAAGVSIVIPVFNKAHLTYQCLHWLIRRTRAGSYEVIVVDNASSDETARVLDHVTGLR